MSHRRALSRVLFVGLVFLLWNDPGQATESDTKIDWQTWSPDIFDQAKREHKFVLLDLQAVWCHWCHVMDDKTYSDPRVIALIQSRYIAVRVDQDAHPDLANRYQDYGWPATVVFNADRGEIVKRQGFLPPEQMTSMLQAIIDDPTPGPSVTEGKPLSLSGESSTANIDLWKKQLRAGYDWKLGSWGTNQKFLNWDNVEYCLVDAQAGDAEAEKMARQTLDAQRQLIDLVWGGVDQYSAEGDWNHPHFEKIMQFQAENMRVYAEAYAQWKDPVYLQTAQRIYGYVRNFLTSPDGVVYTSQDADLIPGEHAGEYFKLNDFQRRKLGVPRVDRHIYARENGWFIQALVALYQASGDIRYRDEAVQATQWIIQNRSIPGGGFRHGDEKTDSISLGDNLAMARAFLSLYAATADHAWLEDAQNTADFIAVHFTYKVEGKPVGFAAASAGPDSLFNPEPDFDENVSLARFANVLFHYTSDAKYRVMAETALRFCTATDVAQSQLSSVGGLLLAEKEMATDPVHITVVGSKDDALAWKLFETAFSFPCLYKQLEWIDGHQSTSTVDAISYPHLSTAAAYLCARASCSSPIWDPEKLTQLLKVKTAP